MNFTSYKDTHTSRFDRTLTFLKKNAPANCKILDLGIENPFSQSMRVAGFDISNTNGEDLDLDYSSVESNDFDLVTAFEIFEHLVAPFNVLKNIKANQLCASVPLNLWFSKAYWNEEDQWDRHYHEFEVRQFNMVLEKAGWEIKDFELWTNPSNKIGFRTILRYFTPRHYIVYCTRK